MDLKKNLLKKEYRSRILTAMKFIPDKQMLSLEYRLAMHEKLNLNHPQTFNEKLQWLKLYDRKPIYSTMVDKYAVKQYVAEKIGEQYIIPTLGVWEHFDDIDFDRLPDQFVLKCTHDSGGLVIVQDKSKFDRNAAREKIQKSMANNFFWIGREWPYKNVSPKIICEKFMVDQQSQELPDYKVHCFNGQPEFTLVCRDRFSGTGLKEDFMNLEWERLGVKRPEHLNGASLPPKPMNYDKMIELAQKLSENIPFARIDFYEIDGCLYFGEITFFPASGFKKFDPEEWDRIWGEKIQLPVHPGR